MRIVDEVALLGSLRGMRWLNLQVAKLRFNVIPYYTIRVK
jgi:hypothetical protein